MPKEMSKTQQKLIQLICQTIYDKKGCNILALDVRGVSSMTDFFVIAEGNVERHVQALATHVTDSLRGVKRRPLRTEGLSDGDWIVLDFGDVIVHLMIPDMREYYALEQVWKEGLVVDVALKSLAS